ncbi:hypothetical protein [Leifsonia poae]|uniref:hypothetical protein n=1 Tax=Leifsonia poae TaxID=110933 RepID=UPI001CBF6888|nr:hypothetical protein [Leifsonia poae]
MTKVDSRPRRLTTKRIVLIVVGAVVVVLVAAAFVVAGIRGAANTAKDPAAFTLPTYGTNSPPPPSAKTTPAPSKDGKVTPPKVDARYGAAVAQTVDRNVDAKLSGGLTATIVSVASVDGKAIRAGETAGPAIEVTISLTNTTGKDVSLAQVSVNAFSGSKSTPAPTLTDGAKPLLGPLAAGATATGVYLFTMPVSQQDSAVITMTDAAGSPITVFK